MYGDTVPETQRPALARGQDTSLKSLWGGPDAFCCDGRARGLELDMGVLDLRRRRGTLTVSRCTHHSAAQYYAPLPPLPLCATPQLISQYATPPACGTLDVGPATQGAAIVGCVFYVSVWSERKERYVALPRSSVAFTTYCEGDALVTGRSRTDNAGGSVRCGINVRLP